jgi:xanthine dehydrogenase accessory factor
MAFTDAIFDGSAALEGVQARRVQQVSALRSVLVMHQFIPLMVGDFKRIMAKLQPHILVDARMRKHIQPERQIHLAPLTIGLGPNFIAGQTVHLAIETAWGERLGQVVTAGSTSPLEGEPAPLEGHSRDRYVYAPVAGRFATSHQIGEIVTEGQEIACIGKTILCAPISGVLRGLTHDNVPVEVKTKVIEVDPRLTNPQISGIGPRPARIAEGVLAAIQSWEGQYAD